MNRPLVEVGPGATVSEAKRIAAERGVCCLAVVDEGILLGIIVVRDLDQAPPHALVCERTFAPSIKISAAANIAEAARLMRSNALPCLPVVKGALIVGIVTAADVGVEPMSTMMMSTG